MAQQQDSGFTGFVREAPPWLFGLAGLFSTREQRVEAARGASAAVGGALSGAGAAGYGAGAAAQGAGEFVAGAGETIGAAGGTAGRLAPLVPIVLVVAGVGTGALLLYGAYRLLTSPTTPELLKQAAALKAAAA